jgi:hypothetical protein
VARDSSNTTTFSVNTSGNLTATSGTVGGWTINSDGIFTGTFDESAYTTSGITISNNGSIHSPYFYVDSSGVNSIEGTIGSYKINPNSINSRLISKATFENDESSTGDNYNGWVRSGTWVRSTTKAYAGSHSMSRYMIDNTASALTYTFTKPQTSNVFLKFAHQFSDGSPTSFVVRKNGSTVFTVNSSSFTVNTWNIFQGIIPHSGVNINTIEIFTTSNTGPTPTLFIDEIELFEGSSIPNNYVNLSGAGLYLPDVSLDKFGIITDSGRLGPLNISNQNATNTTITSGYTTAGNLTATNLDIPLNSTVQVPVSYTFTFNEKTRIKGLSINLSLSSSPGGIRYYYEIYEKIGNSELVLVATNEVNPYTTGGIKNFTFSAFTNKITILAYLINPTINPMTGTTSSTISNFTILSPVFNLNNNVYIYNDGLSIYDSIYLSRLSIKERDIVPDFPNLPLSIRTNKIRFGSGGRIGFDVSNVGAIEGSLTLNGNLYTDINAGRVFPFAPVLDPLTSVTVNSSTNYDITALTGNYSQYNWMYLQITRSGDGINTTRAGGFFQISSIGADSDGPHFSVIVPQATSTTAISQVSIRKLSTSGTGNTFRIRYAGNGADYLVVLFRVKNTIL